MPVMIGGQDADGSVLFFDIPLDLTIIEVDDTIVIVCFQFDIALLANNHLDAVDVAGKADLGAARIICRKTFDREVVEHRREVGDIPLIFAKRFLRVSHRIEGVDDGLAPGII